MASLARSSLLVALAGLAGCRRPGAGGPPPHAQEARSGEARRGRPAPAGPPSPNRVELALRGAITATLRGPGGSCRPFLEGHGAAYSASSLELGAQPPLILTVLVTSEDEWRRPQVVLQRTDGQRRTYAWRHQGGTVNPARDLGRLEIDAVLQDVAGRDTVTIRGTILCPPSRARERGSDAADAG